MVSIGALKNQLIDELFVRTADENYITARWCERNGLNTDFLWLAAHALEKYLKAVLLANGRSSKPYGHDIVKLYNDVKPLARRLLPTKLPMPSGRHFAFWHNRSADEFMADLLRNGNADNRYSIFGYVKREEDIHMLDAMVFRIRRLICPLDERVFKRTGGPRFKHRKMLTRNPRYPGRMNMPLYKLVSAKEVSDIRTAALDHNYAFAPHDFQHSPTMGYAGSMSNPAINYTILDRLKSNDTNIAKDGILAADWLLDNVKIPKGNSLDPGITKTNIDSAIAAARKKHSIP